MVNLTHGVFLACHRVILEARADGGTLFCVHIPHTVCVRVTGEVRRVQILALLSAFEVLVLAEHVLRAIQRVYFDLALPATLGRLRVPRAHQIRSTRTRVPKELAIFPTFLCFCVEHAFGVCDTIGSKRCIGRIPHGTHGFALFRVEVPLAHGAARAGAFLHSGLARCNAKAGAWIPLAGGIVRTSGGCGVL